MKQLVVLTALGVVLFAQTGLATEKKETGPGRRAQKMEEVRVYGIDLRKPIPFRAGLTDVVLVHEYDKRKKEWRFVGTKSASKES
jgi:hypothetical protein